MMKKLPQADFKDLYDKYSGMVYNLSLSYVQNIEEAEEITQDVFVKLSQNIHRFENRSTTETWIYRITVNTCLDFLKARKTKKRFGFLVSLFQNTTNEPLPELSHFNHPGVELEHKEALANIFRHMNQLPERQKTVLILARLEGKSLKEIALITNLTPKAVESLLARAKQNLAQRINSQTRE